MVTNKAPIESKEKARILFYFVLINSQGIVIEYTMFIILERECPSEFFRWAKTRQENKFVPYSSYHARRKL